MSVEDRVFHRRVNTDRKIGRNFDVGKAFQIIFLILHVPSWIVRRGQGGTTRRLTRESLRRGHLG